MSTPDARFGFGEPATAEQIAGWDIDVASDGTGLPPGSGSVQQGEEIFARLGAKCHGAKGEGGTAPPLVGGIGTLNTDAPLKTVGSFWPYAPVLFDYIHRAMPADKPQSLTPDEVYALCAYLLYLNGIVPEDAVMDAQTLPQVVMPNHAGFTSPDPRPDVFTNAEEAPPGTPAA
ncbi:MAG: S-disulfanyl-L-cysteine oxidoreductase SoxD [Thermomicrobiales bacterium]|nr:S-disulfanyl-L-cysteine oxidoreductase SoxD [Thermomicrobiales bacterium]